jgi:DNA primase
VTPPAPPTASLRSLPNDPATRVEREALMMIVQVPHLVGADLIARAAAAGFSNATLAAVRDGVRSQLDSLGGAGWLERLKAAVPEPIAPLVEELAFAVLPVRAEHEDQLRRTAQSTVASLVDRHLQRQIADLNRQLQRVEGNGDDERRRELTRRLVGVQADRRMLPRV